MALVFFTTHFVKELRKKFSESEGNHVLDFLGTLQENPKKGKEIGHIGKIIIKEMKYGNFRFYFVTDGHKIKFYKTEELTDLIIKFVRMSDKKNQQRTIEEIKRVLVLIGEDGF